MPRHALTALAAGLALLAAPALAGTDPHLDPTLVPGGCRACHAGHGASRSPMLARPQREVCLACHESRARADEQVRRGALSPSAAPQLLASVLRAPSVHALTEGAFSRHEPDAVTCTSCHSPHRRSTRLPGELADGTPRPSTRDPQRREHELCESCHGSAGPITRNPGDLARLFDPTSRSFHPVHAPAVEPSPSVTARLSGRQISCTDCHTNGDVRGPRGPHGSPWPALVAANYVVADGAGESPNTYALCWSCHERELVLGPASPFPLHRLHVVEERASCATCHSAHGSIGNRALIRFGEETTVAGVAASASLGRLEFVSESAGSGSCALSCHGVDHAPKGYGSAARLLELLGAESAAAPASPTAPPPPPAPGATRLPTRNRTQRPPPPP